MALVSTEWLRKNIINKNIKILDCSWHMPNSGRSGKLEFETIHIPGSIFLILMNFQKKIMIFLICFCLQKIFLKWLVI